MENISVNSLDRNNAKQILRCDESWHEKSIVEAVGIDNSKGCKWCKYIVKELQSYNRLHLAAGEVLGGSGCLVIESRFKAATALAVTATVTSVRAI